MSFFKKMMPMALGLFLIAGGVFAQGQQQSQTTEVSDEELEAVVGIAVKGQEIQQEMQADLQEMVKEEGLSFQRFQMIMMSQQNPQMADSIEVSAEEQKAMEAIQPKMAEMSKQMQSQIDTAIQNSTVTQQRLQEIQKALQANQQLQQRFQKMMMEEMQSQQNSGGSGN